MLVIALEHNVTEMRSTMPMYEYRCPECGAAFEKIVSFSKADEVPCQECGHIYTQRRVSRVAVRTSGESGSWSDSAACAPSVGGG